MKKAHFYIIVLLISVLGCEKSPKLIENSLFGITVVQNGQELNNGDTISSSDDLEVTFNLYEKDHINPSKLYEYELDNFSIDGKTGDDVPISAKEITRVMQIEGSGTGRIYLKIKETSYSESKSFYILPVTKDSSFTLSTQNTNGIQADGISQYDVTATFAEDISGSAEFTITQGTFHNQLKSITVPIINKEAKVPIIVGQDEITNLITCKALDHEKQTWVTPNASPFETIDIYPSSWVVDSANVAKGSDNMEIVALLGKASGLVSIGNTVKPRAYQIVNGVQVNFGSFYDLPATSDNQEKVELKYFASPGLRKDLPLFIELSNEGGTETKVIEIDVI